MGMALDLDMLHLKRLDLELELSMELLLRLYLDQGLELLKDLLLMVW